MRLNLLVTAVLLLSLVFFLPFCHRKNARSNTDTEVPVITEHENLSNYEGEKITIRGKVNNTKIPTIIGVDVQSYDPDLRGEIAEATGILKKRTVTKEELEQRREETGLTANRGSGTFYRLEDPRSGELSQVQPADD